MDQATSEHLDKFPLTKTLKLHIDQLAETNRMMTEVKSYLTSESLAEAFWRTLIGNRIENIKEATAEHDSLYPLYRGLIQSLKENLTHPESDFQTDLIALTYFNRVTVLFGYGQFCVTEWLP